MNQNSNQASVIKKVYEYFEKENFTELLNACHPKVTFQVPGKSPINGKYTRETFVSGFIAGLKEFSGGTFKFEAHDFLTSDRHAVVLGSTKLTKAGKLIEYRTVHVWRFEDGLPIAWYEYPRDLYQFDEAWSK